MKLITNINNDNYTKYIYDNYDIQDRETTIFDVPEFTMPTDKFNIGLICGNSGSGKTSILKQLGDIGIENFDNDKALISNFDNMSEPEACKALSSVGLGSVPNWLKPYSVLSNGEKFRAELALKISKSKDLILIDEFTSVVDRTVAKAISNSLQKYIRRENKQIVLSSCHYDIIDWLQPDWVYYTETQKFVKKKIIPNQLSSYEYAGVNIMLGIYSKTITI